MLYRPESFEPLTADPWDRDLVVTAIGRIIADADSAYSPEALWEPVDEWDSYWAQLPLTTLYAGAAGVIWALDDLRRRGHPETRLPLEAIADGALAAWRSDPDFPQRFESPVQTHGSLFFGETGPLLVAFRLGGSRDVADSLHARVTENVDNEANELMAGSPGTMLAARLMLGWTGEPRWAEVWRASADVLSARRDSEGLWLYPPYGRAPGGAHGAGTNTLILLQGRDLLPPGRPDELVRGTAAALSRYAVVEDGLANWPMAVEDYPSLVPWDGRIRTQWCHGAPGVVATSAEWLDEELLLAGAELVWRAGPPSMEKGPGICHGTAGNGYALLKAFSRTGDARWLERARRFAVHALGQVERWQARRGRGRHSLWTGDLGAALYAADCLDARCALPVIESAADDAARLAA